MMMTMMMMMTMTVSSRAHRTCRSSDCPSVMTMPTLLTSGRSPFIGLKTTRCITFSADDVFVDDATIVMSATAW